jgi:hypothetical protein
MVGGVHLTNIDQYQVHIPNPAQHTVQNGLVRERPTQGRGSITFMDDGHIVKPLGPFCVQVSFEFDLVYCGIIPLMFISHKFSLLGNYSLFFSLFI